ncbi:MAG: AMMECR1 domain-containing protein, partial [Deltaproteobacteria bacterium]|nr:AMMECR1 domain-containing protein [Deltaproteobacteria bacterium]
MQEFHLSLTDEEKRFCKDLIRWAIAHHLGLPGAKPHLDSETLDAELGAFVTLKRHGQLRGCIGNIVGNGPLVATIERMAGAAAFEDPRFAPVTAAEAGELEIEVS